MYPHTIYETSQARASPCATAVYVGFSYISRLPRHALDCRFGTLRIVDFSVIPTEREFRALPVQMLIADLVVDAEMAFFQQCEVLTRMLPTHQLNVYHTIANTGINS